MMARFQVDRAAAAEAFVVDVALDPDGLVADRLQARIERLFHRVDQALRLLGPEFTGGVDDLAETQQHNDTDGNGQQAAGAEHGYRGNRNANLD